MSIAVPVIPYPVNLLQDEKKLYQFLCACQETSTGNGNSPIISVTQKIKPLDPLRVLKAIAASYPFHFYWESRRKDEAILSYGVATSLTLNATDRFTKAQQFIERVKRRITKVGESLNATPLLLCYFTFFDSTDSYSKVFPSANVVLPQFQIIKKQNEYFLNINILIQPEQNLFPILETIVQHQDFLQMLDKSHNLEYEKSNIVNPVNYKIYPSANFKDSVTSALKSIELNQFSKIVLAHALDVISRESFQVVDCLKNLRQRHPDCYIFSVSNNYGCSFIGASPERLISIENNQLETDALAGSAPRGKTPAEDTILAQKLLRSEKERREHQAVSEFITQQLLNLGLFPHQSPLKLLKLSNIQHLWTPIYAQLNSSIHPLEIISKLHPTPAVAGVPTHVACEQIRQYESFNRLLYAAPIGWVDFQGNSEFIVGIRSALIQNNHARLYAGAGIVAGSDPEKELAEIQLKFQALLKALL
ncbi:isochorismate synthase [Aphanothece hegewaldii CCALA 016]|uniref:isochorismate synthase n=1 Tax=Aphanothece hegewaldii CCALA 016 TaxID=2107694 RepID=A0A2T1LSC6_9CHRO|nr:isochorismate synthase [Aphanothece hegewaldii]PSF32267.1 isochorismate synthase [Aphanothece hegewaldii CCALA 016]